MNNILIFISLLETFSVFVFESRIVDSLLFLKLNAFILVFYAIFKHYIKFENEVKYFWNFLCTSDDDLHSYSK